MTAGREIFRPVYINETFCRQGNETNVSQSIQESVDSEHLVFDRVPNGRYRAAMVHAAKRMNSSALIAGHDRVVIGARNLDQLCQ